MSDHEVFEAGDVVLQNDITLRNAKLAYKTHGTLNAEGTNAVIYPTRYGGTHVDNEFLIGEGMALDPSKYFIPDFSSKNSVESDYLLQTNSYRNFREATKIQGVFPFRAVFRPAAGGFARFRRAIARRPVSPSSFPCFATHR